MPTPLGEALLAATGVTAALRPGPIRINAAVWGKASELEQTIRRKLRSFVRSKELAATEDQPEFDFEEIQGLLAGADDEVRNVENVIGLQGQAAADQYAEALGAAVGYILSFAPAETLPAMVGKANMRPSDLDVSEFRRRYQAVDRPLIVLDDLAAGWLMPDQVEALAACYPSVYDKIRRVLMEEMVLAGTEKPDFRLPYDHDQAMQVLLQTDTIDQRLHEELSKAFEAARERESGQKTDGTPSNAREESINKKLATQAQRIEAK